MSSKPKLLPISARAYDEIEAKITALGVSGTCMRRRDGLAPEHDIWAIDLSNSVAPWTFGPIYLVRRRRKAEK